MEIRGGYLVVAFMTRTSELNVCYECFVDKMFYRMYLNRGGFVMGVSGLGLACVVCVRRHSVRRHTHGYKLYAI